MYLSVSYIQMLKAFTPVCVLIFSYFLSLENPSVLQLILVSIISLGVALASIGEARFSLVGFLFQVSSTRSFAFHLRLTKRYQLASLM
jgi:drug/metabolite transporter (DMT)-like permease